MKKRMNYRLWMLSAFTFLMLTQANGVTRISANSGNWNDSGTWNPAGVPACGDSVIIMATHVISITNQQVYTNCTDPLKIIIYGKLLFYNGSKLSLPCDSYVIVYPGGVVDHDQGFSSSNLINICDEVEWNSNNTLYGLACLPVSHPICALVLAVELSGFSAEPLLSDKVVISWETASESYSDYFSVQRSLDGINWVQISQQDAAGFSSVNSHYNAVDHSPLGGTSFYRLGIHDKDGQITFSDIEVINRNLQTGNELVIAPNPVNESCNITINLYSQDYVRFEWYDLTGKLLLQKEFNGEYDSYSIDGLGMISSGVVVLKAFDKANVLSGTALVVME